MEQRISSLVIELHQTESLSPYRLLVLEFWSYYRRRIWYLDSESCDFRVCYIMPSVNFAFPG